MTGIPGIGKKAAAVGFAKALNCKGGGIEQDVSADEVAPVINGCDTCDSCRKIREGHHPDLLSVSPSGVSIKIEQIRELLNILALRPVEALWRPVIINDAETMNPHAANALLKALEEPPGRTIFILIAGKSAALLPTIVSRCQQIRFSPVPANEIRRHLETRLGAPAEMASVIAAMSNGSLSNAEDRMKTQWFDYRKWLLQELAELPTMPSSGVLALAENLSGDRDRFAAALEIIESWIRDMAVLDSAPEKIINKDLTDTIQYVSQGVAAGTIEKNIRAIRKASRYAEGNANLRLAMEALLFTISAP